MTAGKFRHGLSLSTKRYLRVSAGPLRGQYVHRVVAGAWIGRELTEDEEVHHKDQDKRNFHWENLFILGQKDHGWVSSRQAWFMRQKDEREKKAWDQFMVEEESRQRQEIQQAKADGKAWVGEDGGMAGRYEEFKERQSE